MIATVIVMSLCLRHQETNFESRILRDNEDFSRASVESSSFSMWPCSGGKVDFVGGSCAVDNHFWSCSLDRFETLSGPVEVLAVH